MKMHETPERCKSFVLLMVAVLMNVAGAATYYVSPNGDDANNGTSWATALRTPNAGFAKINSIKGSTLIISNGVYQMTAAIGCTGGSSEANRSIVKGLTGNPDDVIFDAGGAHECLRLASRITVSGITLSNGVNKASCVGAGIRFADTTEGGTDYEIVISNCVVTCCTNALASGSNGAAVALYGRNIMVDSVVRNNSSVSSRGAGVLMMNNGSMNGIPKLKRCRIEGNVAATDGGGVYVASYNGSTSALGGLNVIEIEDCEIVGNTASTGGGGGVYGVDNLDVRLTGCTISGNAAAANNYGGGGIRYQKGYLTLTGCTVADNTALSGGGLDLVPSAAVTLTCSNTVFRSNTVANTGGGVRIYGEAKAFFDDCRFEGNKTTFTGSGDSYGGGGVFLAGQINGNCGYCSVSNCVFGGNISSTRAGGLGGTWNTNFCGAVVNCIFTNNQSRIQGGGLCIRENKANPTPAIIRNCLFAFNETTYDGTGMDSNGGGVLLVTYSDLLMENCTIVSNNIRNASTSYKSGGIHHRWGGKLKNCIVAFNTARGHPEDNASWTAGNNFYFNCCGWPEVPRFTAANGCIAVDPKFVDAAHGDFRLQADSPCINRGENADWMTSTAVNPVTGKRIKVFDLAGVPRLYGANVDIGCYELWFPMGLLFKIQ